MAGKLGKEIHKAKPFESVQQEAFLNVLRTADYLMRTLETLLKPYQLSPTQYNVLRILRGLCAAGTAAPPCASGNSAGNGAAGVPCKAIGEQMITRDPDVTRLLDRLEARGLIARHRDTADRRVVTARITAEGMRVLAELDGPVAEFHRGRFPHLAEGKLELLIELLEQARGD